MYHKYGRNLKGAALLGAPEGGDGRQEVLRMIMEPCLCCEALSHWVSVVPIGQKSGLRKILGDDLWRPWRCFFWVSPGCFSIPSESMDENDVETMMRF